MIIKIEVLEPLLQAASHKGQRYKKMGLQHLPKPIKSY